MTYVGVHDHLCALCHRACEYLHRFQCAEHTCTDLAEEINGFIIHRCSGNRGRPSLGINIEQVELLRGAGFTWQELAGAICISRTTLWRRLREQNIQMSSYSDNSDHDLDELMVTLQHNFSNAGLVMLKATCKVRGYMFRGRE